jgi:hypothetical protein
MVNKTQIMNGRHIPYQPLNQDQGNPLVGYPYPYGIIDNSNQMVFVSENYMLLIHSLLLVFFF